MEHAEWAGEMAKQMRMKKLTGRKLAELTGYTNVYISMVLGGSKNSAEAKKAYRGSDCEIRGIKVAW